MPYQWTTGEVITAAKLNPTVSTLSPFTAAGTTTTLTNSGTTRQTLTGATNGVDVWAFGGLGSPAAILATNEKYTVSSNSHAVVAAMTTARATLCSFWNTTDAYAVSGENPLATRLTTNEAYSFSGNSWSSKAAITTARVYAAGVRNGNIGYVIGGQTTVYLGTNEAYDITANTWSTKATMGTARREVFAAAPTSGAGNGLIYAYGGFNGGLLTTMEEYSISGNTWTSRTSAGTGIAGGFATWDASFFYTSFGSSATSLKYDISANNWVSSGFSVFPTSRLSRRGAYADINGMVYSIGGTVLSTASLNTTSFNPVNVGVRHTGVNNQLLIAYASGATLTNSTSGATGRAVFCKNGEFVTTNVSSDVLII